MRHLTPRVAAAAAVLCIAPAYADLGDQLAKLLANDAAAGDWLGYSVDSGSAYLFSTTTGIQVFKFVPNDGAVGDQFGISVAISGATAIVGALWDDDHGGESGSAYLFDAATPGKCPWDLDDNEVVGATDLIILLGAGGRNPDHSADFDGDGNVGTSDLIALLGNWGPCP